MAIAYFMLYESCQQQLSCDVVPSQFEESLDKSHFSEPWQYAVENSRQKALEVAQRLQVHSNAL